MFVQCHFFLCLLEIVYEPGHPLPLLSAGVGRTGAYITIDAMMRRMEEMDDLNIHDFVTQMRSKRKFMVHNQVSMYIVNSI